MRLTLNDFIRNVWQHRRSAKAQPRPWGRPASGPGEAAAAAAEASHGRYQNRAMNPPRSDL